MKKILIVDAVCPRPYSFKTLETEPLGGSEASVARAAKCLSKITDVTVFQPRHTFEAFQEGAMFRGNNFDPYTQKWDVIIILRAFDRLRYFALMSPDAKIFIWLHNLPQHILRSNAARLENSNITLLGVSAFHRDEMMNTLESLSLQNKPDVAYVHNIVTVPEFSDVVVNPNKLTFLSYPAKGLKRTLELFNAALKVNPEFELHIADVHAQPNPELLEQKNVFIIGRVPQHVALKHVAESLCLFHPNYAVPETFGLSMAEANALGTPVLTHAVGAAPEILTAEQLVDCHDDDAVVAKLMEWHAKRPKIKLDQRFTMKGVTKAWQKVLGL